MAIQQGSAIFSGAGNLSATPRLALSGSALFFGVSNLSIDSNRYIFDTAEFGGHGHFCINALVRLGPPGVRQNSVVDGPGATSNPITWGRT